MRLLARFISLLLLVAAVMAGILDSIQSVAASQISLTPLGAAIFSLNPDLLEGLEALMRDHLPAFAWDPLMIWILSQPAFAVLVTLALVFWMMGYERVRAAGRFAA